MVVSVFLVSFCWLYALKVYAIAEERLPVQKKRQDHLRIIVIV